MTRRLKRMRKWAYLLALAALVAGAAVWARHLSADGTGDLGPLEAHRAAYGYGAALEALAKRPPPAEGFKFAVLGDTRSNFEVALRVVRAAAGEKPAFILSTGDQVRHADVKDYLDHYLPLLEAVAPTPLIPVPGNHDEGPEKDFAAFRALYGEERFSFEYGGWRFAGVNNTRRGIALTGDALGYLRRELTRPGGGRGFVVMHIPPSFVEKAVSSGEPRGFDWNAADFGRLMREAGVAQAFFGHVHGFASTEIDGVRYTITAGGGAPLTSRLGPEGGVYHYVVVHVAPGGVRTEVVKLLGDAWVRSEVQ